MTEGKVGIKETVEMIALVGVVAGLIAKELAGDGLQLSDAVKIIMKPEFQTKLAEAVAGISTVPGELEDLSRFEVLDISEFVLKTTRGIIESLRGARAA